MVVQVKSSQEFKRFINGTKITVVDFFATWCGPCKLVAPMFESMASRYTSVNFIKVDTDELSDVSQECGITAMPTFQIYQKGKKLDQVVGADINSLERKLKSIIGSSGSSVSGKGYVLGTGKSTTASSSSGNQELWILGFFVILLILWWFYQSKEDRFDFDD